MRLAYSYLDNYIEFLYYRTYPASAVKTGRAAHNHNLSAVLSEPRAGKAASTRMLNGENEPVPKRRTQLHAVPDGPGRSPWTGQFGWGIIRM